MTVQPRGPWSFRNPLGSLFGSGADHRGRKDRRKRRLALEGLEGRAMLAATDLAAITGRVFRDATGDGFDTGEQITGATVNLYRDNGDGIFNSATDTLLGPDTTDANGMYRFDNLTAAGYFVEQPAQTVGSNTLQQSVSNLITLTSTDVEGVLGTMIDTFNTTLQTASASFPTLENSSVAAAPEAIGGQRKLAVDLTSAAGTVALNVNNPSTGLAVLDFSSSATATGVRRVIWDGGAGASNVVDADGLGGIDITNGGASTGITLAIGADQSNGEITLRLYTNATDYSTVTITVPNTGGVASEDVYIPFSDFTVGSGAGATLTDIGAIELIINDAVAGVDGQLDTIAMLGPTVRTQNFDNLAADLELTKTINNASPQVGGQVVFTVTVNNTGGLNATGVSVSDQLPAGLTYVSSSASQGSYNNGTGIWTVGNVAAGASATLTITATVTTPGAKTNTAQISAMNEADIDSTPNNNVSSEDDQDDVTLTPQVADLSVTKTVNNATPNRNEQVTFTITVANAGPNSATNVSLTDALPTGLTFVSATPSQGTYNSANGVWTVGTVNNGNSATLTLVATVTTAGVKLNVAQVSDVDQHDPDSTPDNNVPTEDDQDSAQVTPRTIDLALTKTVDNSNPARNSNVTFTLNLSNAGPDTATNVAVTDNLPAGLTFVSATPSQGTYDSTTGIWAVGTVNSGGSATLTMVATVVGGGARTNTAQVTSADQFDVDSTPNNNVSSEDDQDAVVITAQRLLSKRMFLAR